MRIKVALDDKGLQRFIYSRKDEQRIYGNSWFAGAGEIKKKTAFVKKDGGDYGRI